MALSITQKQLRSRNRMESSLFITRVQYLQYTVWCDEEGRRGEGRRGRRRQQATYTHYWFILEAAAVLKGGMGPSFFVPHLVVALVHRSGWSRRGGEGIVPSRVLSLSLLTLTLIFSIIVLSVAPS